MTAPLMLLSDFDPDAQNKLGNSADKAAYMRKLIAAASVYASGPLCRRRFDERLETRYYTARSLSNGGAIYGDRLSLDSDLKSITTLTNGDGSTIASSAYLLRPASPDTHSITAYREIMLKRNQGVFWTSGSADPEDAISVAGVWGYGGSWLNTGATASDVATSTTTTVTVSDGTLCEIGMLIKLDSEYMLITGISSNTLTVTRAYNGSTGAAHSGSPVVYRWSAWDTARLLVERLVAWKLEQNRSPLAGQVVIGDLVYPVETSGIPADLLALARQISRKLSVLGV